jgi:hypothetical protein
VRSLCCVQRLRAVHNTACAYVANMSLLFGAIYSYERVIRENNTLILWSVPCCLNVQKNSRQKRKNKERV